MSMSDANRTFVELEAVLDRLTMLRHLVFGSVTSTLLFSVASKLPSLETLCATAVCAGSRNEEQSVFHLQFIFLLTAFLTECS